MMMFQAYLKKLADQEMKHKEIYQSYKMSLVPKEIVDEDYLSYIKVMLQKKYSIFKHHKSSK